MHELGSIIDGLNVEVWCLTSLEAQLLAYGS
jgi:hypothetical protein